MFRFFAEILASDFPPKPLDKIEEINTPFLTPTPKKQVPIEEIIPYPDPNESKSSTPTGKTLYPLPAAGSILYP